MPRERDQARGDGDPTRWNVHDERSAVREEVKTLLGAVSEQDRTLLIMKEVEGLSLKELSEIYRVNENALKVRLFRARQRVLKAMGKRETGKASDDGG